ncbi:MAG: 2-dehydropantoate 2-reductase [bacterium]|nr:2-dehydropantoate 2-reductase [bacterium]
MRFGIMAAGGVGGYFGGLLHRAGKDVRFIARGEHLAAIRKNGLRVDCVEPGNFTAKDVFVADSPAEAGPCDVVFFCTKTTSNEEAIPAIAPMIGDDTVIISLQNGVDNEDLLAARYGAGRVMGGATYVFTHIAGPGRIEQIGGPRRLVFGEMMTVSSPIIGASARGKAILKELKEAEINAELSEDILRELWTKFIFITGVGAMTAVTTSPLGELMAWQGTRRMLREVMREVYEVGRARGVNLPEGADADRFAFIGEQNPASKASLCHDREAGRRMEIDTFCGAVSRIGGALGVPTPLNDMLYDILKLADLQNAGEIGREK